MRSFLALIVTGIFSPSILAMQPAIVIAEDLPQKDPQPERAQTSKANADTQDQQTPQQDNESPLDFSDTGRPGQQTAGESRGSCANNSRKIQALIPTSHTGKTVSKHPSFWVYFPELSSDFSHVEFSVQSQSRKDIWRTKIDLEPQPGYKQFSIPTTIDPLEEGEWYRWYVKVYCKSQVASAQYVQGWVSRVPVSSQLDSDLQKQKTKPHKAYSTHKIWYDSLDNLILAQQKESGKLCLEKDWQNLIGARGVTLEELPSIGVTHLSQHKTGQ